MKNTNYMQSLNSTALEVLKRRCSLERLCCLMRTLAYRDYITYSAQVGFIIFVLYYAASASGVKLKLMFLIIGLDCKS